MANELQEVKFYQTGTFTVGNRLLDENAPGRSNAKQFLNTITPDTSSMTSRISKFLGIGGAAASGLNRNLA